jgi:hypothetical protein
MRRILVLAVAVAFVALAYAMPAQAFQWLDDPALTSGDATDRLMISAVTVSSTQSSIQFSSNADEVGHFTVNVTACSTCNMTFRVETQDTDGTFYAVMISSAAITATGKTRYAVGWVSNLVTNSEINNSVARALPPVFRVQMLWNSGTSASYTVSGVVF